MEVKKKMLREFLQRKVEFKSRLKTKEKLIRIEIKMERELKQPQMQYMNHLHLPVEMIVLVLSNRLENLLLILYRLIQMIHPKVHIVIQNGCPMKKKKNLLQQQLVKIRVKLLKSMLEEKMMNMRVLLR